ncbi:hypothetical protein QE390_005018 [Siphonobacter sp. SORGH_AS 1065]|nr:hypothetical protein [Siphonobacter sp. SORGH_AS_1065]
MFFQPRPLVNTCRKFVSFFLTCFLLLIMLGEAEAQTVTSVSGRVLDYLYNQIGDYNGLRLKPSKGSEVDVFFPPHTAARIRRQAAIGQQVKVDLDPSPNGPPHPGPVLAKPTRKNQSVIPAFRLIRLQNQRLKTTLSISDLPSPLPQSGPLVQSEGPVVGQMHDEQGRLIALLTNKYLIELKPHQSEQISALLVGAQRLRVTGFERMSNGFVNRTGRPLLHPTSLTIHGQTFAL